MQRPRSSHRIPRRTAHLLLVLGAVAALGCQGSGIETGVMPAAEGGPILDDPKLQPPVSAPTCQADSDCAPLAAGPCAQAVCEPASRRCVLAPRPDFAACDPGEPCAAEAVCIGGGCVVQHELACDDGNPCTHDVCKAGEGCVFSPKTLASCSDGNPCTVGDHCTDGACVAEGNICACEQDGDCAGFAGQDKCAGTLQCSQGQCVAMPGTAVQCDDGSACTVDACDAGTGVCSHTPRADGTPCDDGDLCTTGDVCQAGKCQAPGVLPCGAPTGGCALACDPVAGCVAVADGAGCDDGDACTQGDSCQAGTCVGAPACGCQGDADCDPEGKIPACQGKAVCVLGQCQVDPAQATPCAQTGLGTCELALCGAQGCTTVVLPAQSSCDDGTACTWGDTCADGGACNALGKLTCDDGDGCTVDTCLPSSGCLNGPGNDGKACNDGNPCTTKDVCQGVTCVGTGGCDDGDACTLDFCDPTGKAQCLHQAVPEGSACDDGDPCTSGGACTFGACLPQVVQDCDDGNPCTEDSCDSAGACLHAPIAIDEPIPCDDGDSCTGSDACNAGQCQGQPGLCQCQKTSDCAGFEDGNLCNGTLVCVANACVVDPGTVVACAGSANPCVSVQCQPSTGLCTEQSLVVDPSGAPVPCSDGDACTTADACQPGGKCVGGPAPVCSDDNPCTADGCDAATGCVFPPFDPALGFPCDDGNPCTFGDFCHCVPGAPGGATCGCQAGKNACECQTTADCAAFDDGDLCNGGLVCSKGSCVNDGKGVTCPDGGGACTSTMCDPKSAQCLTFAKPDGTTCDVPQSCASGGQCQAGTCVGAVVAGCDDGNPCTTDSCTAQGCVHAPTAGAVCDDGNACSSGEACGSDGTCGGGQNVCACATDADCPDDGDLCNGVFACNGGTCQPKAGSVVVCDPSQDGPCQANTCQPTSGQCQLVQAATGSACSDGDACTLGDQCQGGKCAAGGPIACGDDNPCTDDGCNPASGCYHVNGTQPCDDGNACTLGDTCSNGSCVGTGTCNCQVDADCAQFDDGNLCNGVQKCVAGKCTFDATTIVQCDPGGDTNCKANLCDEPTGKCAMTPFPDGTGCTDGSLCTSQDQCQQGACKGTQVSCDDGNVCTDDVCDAQKGCLITANSKACDDGNACSQGDVCQGGSCKAGTNVCGVCQTSADCPDDGDLCNGQPSCQGGQCVPGTPVTCPAGSACSTPTCQPATGQCQPVAKGDGAPCDDGDACSATSACFGGACVGGSLLDCDDGNPCTTDSCDKTGGCLHGPGFGACEDGNPCTTGDACDATGACSPGANQCACLQDADCKQDADLCNGTLVCQGNACVVQAGSPVVCDTSKDTACVQTACVPATGACVAKPLADGTGCDDLSLCTVGDACQAGGCQGQALPCDDGNACTLDTCDAALGCVSTPQEGAPCSDGNGCTTGDVCQGATCKGTGSCQCQVTADCAKFEDGDLCNGTLVCQGNACVVDAKTVVTCADDGKGCTSATCDAKTGACQQKPVLDGSPCGGAELCGGSGQCAAGVCQGAIGCADDGNACTTASCDGQGTCSQAPLAGPCDDGNNCTTGDACQAGTCQPGANVCNCKANADCAKFDDGNLCNGVYTCQAGQCQPDPGTVIVCPPAADACSTSACNPAIGQCVVQTKPNGTACDDGNACTSGGQCFSGACLVKPVSCNDGNPCTTDSCNPASGCAFKAVGNFPPTTCDDGDPCTPFSICQSGKCQGLFNQCQCKTNADCTDDANKCNGVPTCQGGTCKAAPGSVVVCDTSGDSACAKSTCLPATGQCQVFPAPNGTACDDANLCTGGDVCVNGACTGIPATCDDGIDCTLDACTAGGGCQHVANHAQCDDNAGCTDDVCDLVGGCIHLGKTSGPCDDQDPCTTGESCQIGPNGSKCMGGKPISCDDKNPCTVDACDPVAGCVFKPLAGGSCDDGNACTTADTCVPPGAGNPNGGKCAGTGVVCDDGNPCTIDACQVPGGCVATPAPGPCDDGNACTTGDQCASGTCQGGGATACDDGNPCTTDACDPKTGCVFSPASGAPCNDGSACTTGDVCSSGACTGVAKSCDDGNACTADSCNAATGACSSSPQPGLPCNDADACTSGDTCLVNGICLGAAKSCDDGNACTADSCAKATGACSNVPVPGACNDGNPCTSDACDPKTGACVATPTPGAPCSDGNPCTVGDVCGAGGCAGAPKACDDGLACTSDSCDAATGACVFQQLPGYSESFDGGGTGGMAFQSFNNQIQWTLDKTQAKSSPVSLYVGRVLFGVHTYNAGPTVATATLPAVAIPAGVQNAKLTFNLFYDRDKNETAGCGGFTDMVAVLVNNQPKQQICAPTGGFQPITVDLSANAGSSVTLALSFVSDFDNNNGQGAWFDDVVVDWDCGPPAP